MNREYMSTVEAAVRQAGAVVWVLAAACFLVPFAAQFCLHPADVVRWVRFLGNGAAITHPQGEIGGLVILGLTTVIIYRALAAFHRRAMSAVALWPVAGIAGFVANAAWWFDSGYFDLWGALAGFAPCIVVNFAERIAMHVVYHGRFGEADDMTFEE